MGIIGGNGAGKSTLFRMVMQQDSPDGGRLELGETVVPMWVDQSREALDADKTVRAGREAKLRGRGVLGVGPGLV